MQSLSMLALILLHLTSTNGLSNTPKIMEEILLLDERNIVTATKGGKERK